MACSYEVPGLNLDARELALSIGVVDPVVDRDLNGCGLWGEAVGVLLRPVRQEYSDLTGIAICLQDLLLRGDLDNVC